MSAPERRDDLVHEAGLGPLAVLLERPSESAVLTDFDGTLAPIVADAAAAVPLVEAPAVLRRLAVRFGVVAVVSGRPASFLAERLVGAGSEVQLFGLYGLEWVEGGKVVRDAAVESWLDPVAGVVAAARSQLAPLGVRVEDKGASVTVHWRQAPEVGPEVTAFARRWAQRTGLALQPGRMALEFRPPVGVDKGSVVERLARGLSAACFAGDDVGDLAAFAALDRLGNEGTRAVRMAVADEEVPAALIEAADVVVATPAAALALFDALAASPGR